MTYFFVYFCFYFIGSNQAGEYIYDRGTKQGKRVQANLGAKNHGTIMPGERESEIGRKKKGKRKEKKIK